MATRHIGPALALLALCMVLAGCGTHTAAPALVPVQQDTTGVHSELDSLLFHSRQHDHKQLFALGARIEKATRGEARFALRHAQALGAMANVMALQPHGRDSAIALIADAVRAAEVSGDSVTLARMLMGESGIRSEKGDHVGALVASMRALRIREARGDSIGVARLLEGIGELYWRQNDLPAAMAAVRRAIQVEQRIDSAHLCFSLGGLGIYMLEAKRPDTAAVLLKQAVALKRHYHAPSGAAVELSNLGLAYSDLGQLDSALAVFHDALTSGEAVGDPIGTVGAYKGIGEALLRLGRYAEARAPLDSGLAIATANEMPDDASELHHYLSVQHERMGDAPAAYAHLLRYRELHDSLMSVKKEATMNDLRVRYEVEKKDRENQQLRTAQELSALRVARGRWIAWAVVLLAAVIGVIAWLLLQRNRERARQREAELEQQALRLQMDPHFLFNALNTIPGLYASGDAAHADDHVGHLSKFLRSVLETSRQRMIPLAQELELVDNYLHICANRRPGSFTWTISVAPEVRADALGVPPMLVQPLVENALEHGLQGITQGGHVDVQVAREADVIRITVRDNGIGRAAAGMRPMPRKGRSLGLGLVRERVWSMGHGRSIAEPVDVQDEHHADGSPAGTTVVLRLPSTELRHHVTRSDH